MAKTIYRMNVDSRRAVKRDFEKDFFKLMNNAVFGKSTENLQNFYESSQKNYSKAIFFYSY